MTDIERFFTLPEDDPRHGRYTTYTNYGCRCRPCTDDYARSCYERKQRRVAEATGTAEPRFDMRAVYQRAVIELRRRHQDEFEAIKREMATG